MMEKIHILILEDDLVEAEELTSLLHKNDYKTTHVPDAIQAIETLRQQTFDMMILDIMIDGKPKGIELAQTLEKDGIEVPFIFLTSIRSRAIFEKAKYTKPFSYLLKPYNELELLYVIELAIETFHQQKNTISREENNAVIAPEFFFVKKGQKIVKVNVNTISYIKVDQKYCQLVCDTGNYLIRLSLSKVIEVLANSNFKQTHRNYVINSKKIKELYMEDNLIIMEADHQIPFSTRFKTAFLKDGLFLK
ncbi:LytR/AlgR family response regulator transcription factor [Kordia sp.]|uniref:LytR/AlgR family response regulator transcription factor n=1 Tax=Kordia sp. TaxID=1965332 RepID=UPI003D2B4FB4